MRKILSYLLILASLAVPACVFPAYCGGNEDSSGIDINQGGDKEGGPSHRAPALIPIEAAYNPSLSGVILDFLYDLGMVTVSVENLMTGEMARSVVAACAGVQFLPVSGEAGMYKIMFTLPDGRWYWGTFEIE